MSTKLKVAGIQMISGAVVSENLDRVSVLVEQAAQQGAQLVALPEYFCAIGASDAAKLRMAEPFNQTASESPIQSTLAALAKQYGIWLAGGTVPILNEPHDPLVVFLTRNWFIRRLARWWHVTTKCIYLILKPRAKAMTKLKRYCPVKGPLSLSVVSELLVYRFVMT